MKEILEASCFKDNINYEIHKRAVLDCSADEFLLIVDLTID